MDITFKEMNLDDLEKIKNNLISDFDDFWTYETLKGELLSSSSKYIVAIDKNEIIGFAGIKIVLDEADIMNIVTKRSNRNKGIGSLLLENLILLANKLNVKSIILEVNEENSIAIHLYKKYGFKKIAIRKNYYKNKNAIIMKKKLP